MPERIEYSTLKTKSILYDFAVSVGRSSRDVGCCYILPVESPRPLLCANYWHWLQPIICVTLPLFSLMICFSCPSLKPVSELIPFDRSSGTGYTIHGLYLSRECCISLGNHCIKNWTVTHFYADLDTAGNHILLALLVACLKRQCWIWRRTP